MKTKQITTTDVLNYIRSLFTKNKSLDRISLTSDQYCEHHVMSDYYCDRTDMFI